MFFMVLAQNQKENQSMQAKHDISMFFMVLVQHQKEHKKGKQNRKYTERSLEQISQLEQALPGQ